jgi:anti-sigma factor RsiW
MSHLDEGTLHALLDGELDLAEVSEIQMHLGSCVACGSRLQEVKQVLAEADRLVGTMEVPAQAATTPPPQRPVSRPSPPPLSQPRDPGIWDEAPVLLVPDPIDANVWRKRWLRGLGLAATIAIVVAGGRLIGDALKPGHPVLSDRDLTTATPAVPPAVASSEETRRSQPAAAPRERARVPQTRTPSPTALSKTAAAASQRALDSANELKDSAAGVSVDSFSTDSSELASQTDTSTTSVASASPGAEAESASVQRARQTRTDSASTQQGTATNRPNPDDDLATRQAAAAALAELDRQRRRERANAATAALPPARPEPIAAESAPPPARVPTLEERSQIYLRIGLDEAVRQLGGPVHVIEGMTPQFIGLVRGQQVPGASPRRPVVRVVYLDPRGRMILLDQQRLDSPQAPGATSGNLRWALGDVMLYLRGEPSQDVLRSLQARVR